jgi:hypothetical protein
MDVALGRVEQFGGLAVVLELDKGRAGDALVAQCGEGGFGDRRGLIDADAPTIVHVEAGLVETDSPQDREGHGDPHPGLGNHRPPGRALDSEIEAVDEGDLEDVVP